MLYIQLSVLHLSCGAADMAPLYEHVCKQLGWSPDVALLQSMQEHNAARLKELDAKIDDAEQNLSEMEVREANLTKSEHLCRIGDKVGRQWLFLFPDVSVAVQKSLYSS